MKSLKRFIASLLIFSMSLAGFPLTAQAAIVSTDEVIAADVLTGQRERVSAFALGNACHSACALAQRLRHAPTHSASK